MDETHKAFMKRALDLARRGRGRTSPNPLVGAVVVKAGQVVGEGYHQRAGTPHAEIHALNAAGENAKGATLYVNLEPCCHWGRTPPCTEAVLQTGVAEVYVAEVDPNPSVAGNGIRQLQDAGLRVHVGTCAEEAAQLNEVHKKYIQTRKPFVILKTAMSLDGKIATASGESHWITSEGARQRGHEIRDAVDAILVGKGTVVRDNPALTTRLQDRAGQDATRIVLDSYGSTSTDARIFNPESRAGVIIAVTPNAPTENLRALEKAAAEVITVPAAHDRVCFEHLMGILGAREITSVLVEGGGEVNASAIAAGVVDKVMCFIAPKLIGGRDAPGPIGGEGISSLSDVPRLQQVSITSISDSADFLIEGYL
ncbi:MAG: bifunctional diaminohydroxyphosphoribosylaminopyrimidine deaminase/5-amino-6-(5-phosphoribosylamino)uracil reductase RibD [Candidatus Poribacteria bacterium]|nr:bifunctional diaminohydroxyphosphoribosylaminopyrimidine deaminase/5-amino-6-(5-phosphoribosylamino)uracil reductase RibD [Candidatus Poribacteria bacterium]